MADFDSVYVILSGILAVLFYLALEDRNLMYYLFLVLLLRPQLYLSKILFLLQNYRLLLFSLRYAWKRFWGS